MLDEQIRRVPRIAGALNPREAGAVEDPFEQVDVGLLVVHDEQLGLPEVSREGGRRIGHPVFDTSALAMASAAGESGHTTAGAAVYDACANAPWKNAVSDA